MNNSLLEIPNYDNESIEVGRTSKKLNYPIGFSIFYGDGSVFYSHGSLYRLKEDWIKSEDDNIQVVVVLYNQKSVSGKNYRAILSGKDYYYFDGFNFFSSNDKNKKGMVKKGSLTSKINFEIIMQRALIR